MAGKVNKNLVFCGKCKNCTPITEPEKCSVTGEPIIGTCPYWIESKSCLLSWPHVCIYYDAK